MIFSILTLIRVRHRLLIRFYELLNMYLSNKYAFMARTIYIENTEQRHANKHVGMTEKQDREAIDKKER